MKTFFTPFLGLTALAAVSAPVSAATLAEAQAAYARYDVNAAERLYQAVAEAPDAPAADRAAAQRELARIAWLVDNRQSDAADRLAASLLSDPDPCPAALLYGRVLNTGDDPAATMDKLAPYAAACADIEPGVAVEGVRGLYLAAIRLPFAKRASAIAAAKAAWHALPAVPKQSVTAARLRLAIGLAAGDGAEALAGWRAFFWMDAPQAAPQGLGLADAAVEAAFLKGARGNAAPQDAMALAELLMRAGFADELSQLATDRDLPNRSAVAQRWARIEDYLSLFDRLEAEILPHDRAYARHGAGDEEGYKQRLETILAEAARATGIGAGDDANPMAVLSRAYNLWGVIGETNGVMSLHLGHIITDERQPVEQDGRRGEVRLIVLDNMISNSFFGWLMDGDSAPGGWAEDGQTIVQVRGPYVATIDGLPALVKPGPVRDRYLAGIAADEAAEIARARTEGVVYLKGVRQRLRLAALDSLARTLADEADFDTAFRRAFWNEVNRNSITLHEGRHVLDQASFTGEAALSSAELEYRAKLSEVGLSNTPRLALANVYIPAFGDGTGHGTANKRLIEQVVAWMEQNQGTIAGYDPALPALVQLYKLSDEQVRTIARTLDRALTH